MKTLQILVMMMLFSFSAFSTEKPVDKLKMESVKVKPLESKIARALKQALTLGVDSAVTRLSALNGFYKDEIIKIILPPEASKLVTKLNKSKVGKKLYNTTLQPTVDSLVLSMNRAAEDASKKAAPIFWDAIKTMSIPDALKILNGPDTAATSYLHGRTYDSLVVTFKPAIQTSLDKKLVGGQSTSEIWKKFINTYKDVRKSPASMFLRLDAPTEEDLSKYVTMKALDGVFLKVGEQEKKIRKNPKEQATNLLKNVFGKLKKKSDN